jgi:cytoskeletal protein CcmA (bactofilin family)
MGKWLGTNKPPDGADEWIGFLDQGVKLEGTLELTGTFRVDGEVHGALQGTPDRWGARQGGG